MPGEVPSVSMGILHSIVMRVVGNPRGVLLELAEQDCTEVKPLTL